MAVLGPYSHFVHLEQEGERVIAFNAPFLSFSLYRICPFGWTEPHVLSDMFQTQAGGICTAPCTYWAAGCISASGFANVIKFHTEHELIIFRDAA